MAEKYNGVYIIAADTGNGNVKTVSTCTPTSVSKHNSKPLTTTNVIEYNGSYYVIGQGHKELVSDKTQDEDYYILTLFCIAKELARDNVTEASVLISAGLPVTWYGNQSESYRNYLKQNKEVQFSLDGVTYKVEIKDALILPQGYAAIIENLPEMKGDNMLADIGNGTINILRVRNSNGVKLLDDYAVEFLKPKNVTAEKYNMVCAENDKLRVQNISLVSDNEDLQKRVSTLEGQIQKERSAAESFRSDSSKYFQLSMEKDKRISELENRISDISALLDEKDSRISDLEREISSLREMCDSQKSEIAELKDKCSEQEEALAAIKGNKGIFGLGKR